MRDQIPDTSHIENGLHNESDFTGHIETGFQLATFQGPLCAEPVEGVAYFVEEVRVDVESLEKEIGTSLAMNRTVDPLMGPWSSPEQADASDRFSDLGGERCLQACPAGLVTKAQIGNVLV